MKNILYSIVGILIPFIGTSLGSGFVLFLKKDMGNNFKKIIVGFASGVMLAASIWSLILPSIEMAENQNTISWLPASIGFSIGILFLIVINKLAQKLEQKKNGKKLDMLMFSVTLHNIPEGMAVRSMFCGIFSWNCRNRLVRSYSFSNWNCDSKYTRRSYNFNATENEWGF